MNFVMTTVNVHEAKTQFSRLLEQAHRGEEIILAKAGVPYARLVPLERPAERIPGLYRDSIPDDFFVALSDDELDECEK